MPVSISAIRAEDERDANARRHGDQAEFRGEAQKDEHWGSDERQMGV